MFVNFELLKGKKTAFYTLGCKVNQYETDGMTEILKGYGCEIVPFSEQADIYIINTCSVTNMAERKSRQIIHRAKKLNPDAILVACGCYVQAAARELQQDNHIDIVVGNNRKADIARILDEYIGKLKGVYKPRFKFMKKFGSKMYRIYVYKCGKGTDK